MKKVISILMTLAFMFTFITGCTAAESDKQALDNEFLLTMQIANLVMTVNGQEKNIDDDGTAPTIVNDRTLVPVRAIIESMGGSVNWDSDTSTAMLEYNNDIITLTIGSETAYFNDNANTLDTAPQIINDRIMLPIRFIAESFKFDVEWEQGTQTITIKSNTLNPTVTTEPTIAPDNQTNGSKALVVYYSASGTTEKITKYIANAANADIFEIEPEEKYSEEDLNWTNRNSRVSKEHDDESLRAIKLKKDTVDNWSDYDTVLIGYPIWWGIAAWPVDTFVKANDFNGKTVIPLKSFAFTNSNSILHFCIKWSRTKWKIT